MTEAPDETTPLSDLWKNINNNDDYDDLSMMSEGTELSKDLSLMSKVPDIDTGTMPKARAARKLSNNKRQGSPHVSFGPKDTDTGRKIAVPEHGNSKHYQSLSLQAQDEKDRPKTVLSRVALFLGEARDGLTMLNMQNAFLVTSKHYSEKQAGIMFFVFGMSQFVFQTPAGYFMDNTDKKVLTLGYACVGTTLLTICTVLFAHDGGDDLDVANFAIMVFIKFLQGAITALIPPALNSISQGIVGVTGMTTQVSVNEMMNHLGTAIIILIGSIVAYVLYPDIGLLFAVSPVACLGVIYFLMQIEDGDIDHDAARGLTPTPKSETKKFGFEELDMETFAYGSTDANENGKETVDDGSPESLSQILRDRTLLTFIFICFCFHLGNGTVLPLVMQKLAIGNGKTGIVMSGFCIIVSQGFMVGTAKLCGKYAGVYGRKGLFLIGFLSLPIRCGLLSFLLSLKEEAKYSPGYAANFYDYLILSTQVLDGIGAGVFGTMYVLVTSDLSMGTGRFNFMLGLTTTAVSIGGTVSGYLGQAFAEDFGYLHTFSIIGCMSLIPVLLYFFFMPETLPQPSTKTTLV